MNAAYARWLTLPPLILALAHAHPSAAQSLSASTLNAGYGRRSGEENRPVDPSTRDANNNRVIVNGMLGDPSGLSGGLGAGLGDSQGAFSGTSQLSVSAVANQINVVAAGSWNTIIIDATQTNSGAVQATANLQTATVTDVAR